MFSRILFSVWLLVLATPLAALDPGPMADNVVVEWQKWMTKHGIPAGSIIVSYKGDVLAKGGIKRSVDDPAKVASLSKAITAVCALQATNAAGKTPNTSLSEAIPAALGEHVPRDKTFGDITIGQLITHTSGITSTYHRTQLAKLRTFGKENKLWQFSKVASDKLGGTPGQAGHEYANANYLTLGLVIEELSGESYEDYCKRSVLDPAGVTTGKLNDDWRVMSSWGGWEISARDYLKFAEWSFGGANAPDRPAGFAVMAAPLERGRNYSAGVLFRQTSIGTNVWHNGSWVA